MSSISISMVHAQTIVERAIAIEGAGKQIVRWGLIVVLAWIGAMKFTAYEAMGIQPLVAHSPFVGWMYDFLTVRSLSAMLGCIEIVTAALISLRYVSPKASSVAFWRLDCSPRRSRCSSQLQDGNPLWASPRCRRCPDNSCSRISFCLVLPCGRWASRSKPFSLHKRLLNQGSKQ
jgi:Protein of unknown function, DUF417